MAANEIHKIELLCYTIFIAVKLVLLMIFFKSDYANQVYASGCGAIPLPIHSIIF